MGIVGRHAVGWRVRGGSDISSRVDGLLQGSKVGGRERATFSRTVQVLEGDNGSIDPCGFVFFRVADGERNPNQRAVDGKSGLNVLDQRLRCVCEKQRVRSWVREPRTAM